MIPELQARSISHGLTITAEFSSLHDQDRWGDVPLEHSTRIALGIGSATTATELLATDRIRGWAMSMWANLTATHKINACVLCRVGSKPLN